MNNTKVRKMKVRIGNEELIANGNNLNSNICL